MEACNALRRRTSLRIMAIRCHQQCMSVRAYHRFNSRRHLNLKESLSLEVESNPRQTRPFGGASRICTGKDLPSVALYSATAALSQQFVMELHESTEQGKDVSFPHEGLRPFLRQTPEAYGSSLDEGGSCARHDAQLKINGQAPTKDKEAILFQEFGPSVNGKHMPRRKAWQVPDSKNRSHASQTLSLLKQRNAASDTLRYVCYALRASY